ncbi:hypothetical protein MNBD_DELTA01-921 [hydrothermal vent metagenome]|uniref:Lipoprotein n=1 Tax=hydrothermal vent metagenome TaxID=652676 RepID=A0A3B0QQ94_9ZZZZ
MKSIFLSICMLLAAALIASGCASNSVNLRSKELTGYVNNKKILIVVSAEDNNIEVIDRIGGLSRHAARNMIIMGGVVGYLGARAGVGAVSAVERRKSLGGNIKVLRKELDAKYFESASIKDILERDLLERFSNKYEVVLLPEKDYKARQKSADKKAGAEDYVSSAKDVGADIILYVDFTYGLAVYRGEKASAAVDARISVYDVNRAEVIMRRGVSSDLYFKSGHTVDEFAIDGALIFSKDIEKAVDSLSLRIASEFGVDLDELAGRRIYVDEMIAYNKVTCHSPYVFTQGCSGGRKHFKNYTMLMAGTEAGDVVLLRRFRRKPLLGDYIKASEDMDGMENTNDRLENALTEAVTNKTFYMDVFKDLKAGIEAGGVNVVRIIELTTGNNSSTSGGYILELDGDGYSILKDYSKDKVAEASFSQKNVPAIAKAARGEQAP